MQGKQTDECFQEQCSFNKNFSGKGKLISGCPTCSCGATSNVINKSCKECLSCENIAGFLRGDGKQKTAEEIVKEALDQALRNLEEKEQLPKISSSVWKVLKHE